MFMANHLAYMAGSPNELQCNEIKISPLFSLAISERRCHETSSSVVRVNTAFTSGISFCIASCNFLATASVTFLSKEYEPGCTFREVAPGACWMVVTMTGIDDNGFDFKTAVGV